MYEKLGRMMGRSYEETVQLLSKSFKNMESQSRIETMLTFEKVVIHIHITKQFMRQLFRYELVSFVQIIYILI